MPNQNEFVSQYSHFVNIVVPIYINNNYSSNCIIEDTTFYSCTGNNTSPLTLLTLNSIVLTKICAYNCFCDNAHAFTQCDAKTINSKNHTSLILCPREEKMSSNNPTMGNWGGNQNLQNVNISNCFILLSAFHQDTLLSATLSYFNIADCKSPVHSLGGFFQCQASMNYFNMVRNEAELYMIKFEKTPSAKIENSVILVDSDDFQTFCLVGTDSVEVTGSFVGGNTSNVIYTPNRGSDTFAIHIVATRYCGGRGAVVSYCNDSTITIISMFLFSLYLNFSFLL